MTFGVQFVNTGNVVTLDSEFARLSILANGRYAPNSDSGKGTTVTFPAVITTQEPPLIFIRPDASGIAGMALFRPIGGAGAWTGFYFYGQPAINAGATAAPNGEYFAAAFASSPAAAFGARIWDGSGNLIFDSGTPAALFTRAYQTWTYVTSVQDGQGYYWNYYKLFDGLPAAGEFILLNNFGMPLVSGGTIGRQLGLYWDFTSNTLRATTNALNNPYNFWLSVFFAKKAV